MKLVKWGDSSWRAVEDLQNEINRLFDFSYGKSLAPAATLTVPSVDISEDENNVYVEADVPGFEQKVCQWVGFDTVPSASNPLYDPNTPMDCSLTAEGSAPMIGYVAWERSFPANPDGNYGRAVAHSFEPGSD